MRDPSVPSLVAQTIDALRLRRMEGHYLRNIPELMALLDTLIPDQALTGTGDSLTLEETGVFEYLRQGRVRFLDKHQPGLTREEKRTLYLQNFTAHTFFSGVNAIGADGTVINIDGNGSRVAPILFGPEQVLLVVGTNKLTADANAAMERARQIAAPLDARRLGKNTPCVKTGRCSDCRSAERICNDFVTIGGQLQPGRIKVLILEGHYGF